MKLLQCTMLLIFLTASHIIECSKTAGRPKSVKFETSTTMAHHEPTQPSPGEMNARMQHPEAAPKNSQAPAQRSWGTWWNEAVYDVDQGWHGGWLTPKLEVDEPSLDMQSAATEAATARENVFEQQAANPEAYHSVDAMARTAMQQSLHENLSAPVAQAVMATSDGIGKIGDTVVATAPYIHATAQAIADPGTFIVESGALKATYDAASNAPKKIINNAVQRTARAINNALKAPKDPKSPSFFEDQTYQDLGDLFNAAVETAAETISSAAKNSMTPSKTEQSPPSSSSFIKPEVQRKLNQAKADVIDAGMYHGEKFLTSASEQATSFLTNKVHEYVEQKYGKPADPVIVKQQALHKEMLGELLTKKTLLPRTKKETASKDISAKTSTMTNHFTSLFSRSAQQLKKSPQYVKAFLKNVVSSLSSFAKFTETETIQLQELINQEADNLLKDQNSFIHADKTTFQPKFNNWMKSFINKCYIAVGRKAPTNTKIISIQEQALDSSAPKISVSINDGKVQSALVNYNNRSYNIDPQMVTLHKDGSIVVENIPLFENSAPQTLFEQMHSALYNSTLENSIAAPLKSSAVGKMEGVSKLIDDVVPLLKAGQDLPTKLLSITYSPKKSIITQEADVATKVISTKEYDAQGKITQQKFSIPTIGSEDVLTPDIDFTCKTTSTHNPQEAIDINISHTNPITGEQSIPQSIQKTYDATTEIYRVEALYKVPENNTETRKAQLLNKLIENNMIEPGSQEAVKVEAIIDTMLPLIAQYPGKVFKDVVNNFSSIVDKTGYVPANINKLVQSVVPKETLQFIQDFLLEPLPTSIQSVVIEFDPKTQTISRGIVKRMSAGDPKQIINQFPPAQSKLTSSQAAKQQTQEHTIALMDIKQQSNTTTNNPPSTTPTDRYSKTDPVNHFTTADLNQLKRNPEALEQYKNAYLKNKGKIQQQ